MKLLEQIESWIRPFAVPIVVALLLIAFLWVLHRTFISRLGKSSEWGAFQRQLIMIFLAALGGVIVILALPIKDKVQTNLLALTGILISGVIALSSTTLVANAMAGFMLRSVKSFRCGDFVRIGSHFGRVTERGLFHTEIQTEDRDLTTLPNLYLISNPVTVVRSSGTIVSATLSLGYDVAHDRVEPLLLDAARYCGLEDPFVRVMELGNFAVTYRVSGLLPDTKQLLTTKSMLNAKVLDVLHGKGIEIVSPNFMTQRQLAPTSQVIPTRGMRSQLTGAAAQQIQPEEVIFDKAEEAERVERLRQQRNELNATLETLEKKLKEVDEGLRPTMESEITRKRQQITELDKVLEISKR